jgi:predicted membrane protein
MTKTIINITLTLIFAGLVYVLSQMIYAPVAFKAEKNKRERAVAMQMNKIRSAQQAYKDIKGVYAPSFEELANVLKKESFEIVTIIGDADANEQVTKKVTYVAAADSMATLGINLDSLSYVPYANDESVQFQIQTDTIDYQSTKVPVVEVKIAWKDFMGKYASGRYKAYDPSYNPDNPSEKNYFLKFGDMTKPSLNANWQRFGKEDKNE